MQYIDTIYAYGIYAIHEYGIYIFVMPKTRVALLENGTMEMRDTNWARFIIIIHLFTSTEPRVRDGKEGPDGGRLACQGSPGWGLCAWWWRGGSRVDDSNVKPKRESFSEVAFSVSERPHAHHGEVHTSA